LVNHAIEALVPIVLGGATFMIAAKMLRVKELEQAISTIRRKFAR